MRRENVFVLTLFPLLASLFCVGFNAVEVKASDGIDTSRVYGVEMLWNNSMSINDVAVPKNGTYLVAVNNTGVYYFASNNSSPKWWYLSDDGIEYFLSVAISADGEYVVAGDYSGYIHYYNDSIATTGRRLSPTWKSIDLGSWVERGTLDMSDDGEYVVTGGTGIDVWYFAGCRGRSGTNEQPTWSDRVSFPAFEVLAVDMSSDGAYVAVGGWYDIAGFVVFYKNANMAPYPTEPDWLSSSSIDQIIGYLALSDDGYAVVAIDDGSLYYWANATTLTGDPNATWTNPGNFSSVDMSSDGNNVVAGGASPQMIHFWSNAREREGTQEANWVRYQSADAPDIAMSDNGNIIAAPARTSTSNHTVYLMKSDGGMISEGEFDLLQYSPLVSMSGYGNIIAVGGPGFDSLYVFEVLEDSIPPLIENVYQQPANDTVTPDDEVVVYANVTDLQSGVKQVILNYTNGNGTWITTNMTNLEGNVWNGTIPTFDYCTYVNYTIIAEDKVGNNITTEEAYGYQYQYHVIPEFPSFLILPLFMAATLLAAVAYRRKSARQG